MMSFNHMQATLRLLYRERHAPEHLKLIADVWWWGMLVIGIVLFIIAVSFSAYELIRSRDVLSATENTVSKPAPALDKNALETALTQFESRAALYPAMRAKMPTTTDPSL